ncbi:MAG: YebC/PmpR family DNA-binding transcriptional regulator [Candidatus Margulisbacteria bacterium]|nr:YebC/PmpR family DNA-binding transcriptional regulator [Candidatus Margulisiibacteriota bacterium]
MSGHSKWSTIKHKKAKTDAQKGKAFTKVVREMMMAVKLGGSDPGTNSRLRLALQKAKEVNMPADNIKRAIKKGEGPSDDDQYEEVMFEAYGPFGVGILIETLTNNRNRTVPNLRQVLGKAGGSLATSGAVSYMFDKKAVFIFEPGISEELVMDVALAVDVEEVEAKDDGSVEVIAAPAAYSAALDVFEAAGLSPANAELTMLPKTVVTLSSDQAEKIVALLEKLEEDDDVQNVYANFDFSDELK